MILTASKKRKIVLWVAAFFLVSGLLALLFHHHENNDQEQHCTVCRQATRFACLETVAISLFLLTVCHRLSLARLHFRPAPAVPSPYENRPPPQAS